MMLLTIIYFHHVTIVTNIKQFSLSVENDLGP